MNKGIIFSEDNKFEAFKWLIVELRSANLLDKIDTFLHEMLQAIDWLEYHGNLKGYGCETCAVEDYPVMYSKMIAKIDHLYIVR